MSLRESLRAPASSPFSLFSFQDIIFCVTGILLLTAVFFALATKLDRFSREPSRSTQEAALRAEIDRELTARQAALNRTALVQRWRATTTAADRAAKTGEGASNASSARSIDPRLRYFENASFRQGNAPLYERHREQQRLVAERLRALEHAESEWITLQQRILRLQSDQRHILLRPDPTPSLKETVLLVISDTGAQLEWFGDRIRNEHLSLPVSTAERERFVTRFSPAHQRLVLFFKPSGARWFDALRADFRRLGFEVGLEPVPEDFTVHAYSRDAAQRLLQP